MSTIVPIGYFDPGDDGMRIGRPASSIRVAAPCADNINHLLGHILGGVRHIMILGGDEPASSPTYRMKTHRHPNCDHLEMRAWIDDDIAGGTAVARLTAGNGTQVSLSRRITGGFQGNIVLRAPWDASDSGVENVVAEFVNWAPKTFTISDVPRDDLDSGDDRIAMLDDTYPAIGLIEQRAIAQGSQGSIKTMLSLLKQAWDDYRPQVFSWAEDSGSERSVAAGAGWVDVFGTANHYHAARKKKSTDTYRTSQWYHWTFCDAGITSYQFRVSSSLNTVTSATLSNVGGSWQTALTGLQVPVTADKLTFEMQCSGTGSCYVRSICGIEDA